MRTLSGVTLAQRNSLVVVLASIMALAMTGFSGPVAARQSGPTAPSAPSAPEATCPPGGQCFADVPPDSLFYEYANNLYIQDIISGYACGGPGEPCDAQNRPYYRPVNSVTRAQMTKFVDLARTLPGIHIDTATNIRPFYSRSTATAGAGVVGESTSGMGVFGRSVSGYALIGFANSGVGVQGGSDTGDGVVGISESGYAGRFYGDVEVTGTCTGCTGPSKIDHPLDPANKYLTQSPVESADMKTIYDGIATLDATGEAWVEMPAYSQSLNKNFRYQLTPIGAPGRDLYIAQEVKDNRFKIAGGKPGMKVSWQVTGIKQDPYSEQNRTPVEEDKPEEERGLYLHPEAYGLPDSKQVGKVDPY